MFARKYQFFGVLALSAVLGLFSWSYVNKPAAKTETTSTAPSIQWLTWEQAIEANKKEPRKWVIDLYTDWCGWCKVMDKETFPNAEVADYISKNFYAVKFNAEQREALEFNGHTFTFQAGGGRGGVHELAVSLLNGQMGYPTLVYLTPTFERILISPGYKKPEDLMPELNFVQTEAFRTTDFETYKATFKK